MEKIIKNKMHLLKKISSGEYNKKPNYFFCKKKKIIIMSTKQFDLVVLHLIQCAEQDPACRLSSEKTQLEERRKRSQQPHFGGNIK